MSDNNDTQAELGTGTALQAVIDAITKATDQ